MKPWAIAGAAAKHVANATPNTTASSNAAANARRMGVRRVRANGIAWRAVTTVTITYPSSWYNKANSPVRLPTQTGSQAATIGFINSALLRSSVTF